MRCGVRAGCEKLKTPFVQTQAGYIKREPGVCVCSTRASPDQACSLQTQDSRASSNTTFEIDNRDFMQGRLFQTSCHSSSLVECGDWPVPWKLCTTSPICVLFLTLALTRRAPQTSCIKSLTSISMSKYLDLCTFWKCFCFHKNMMNTIDQEPVFLNQNFSVSWGLKLIRRGSFLSKRHCFNSQISN